jgi:hypothetical protein
MPERHNAAAMRQFVRFALLVGLFGLTACSHPKPPIGRWEGVYEDQGVIIVARLQIDSEGKIRVSAPNAITDQAPISDTERDALREKLQAGLAAAWPDVPPLPLEFDGHAFHKAGGVAPQLEWDIRSKRMVLVFYSGNRPSIRVPLESVRQFANS